VNTSAVQRPELISEIAQACGSQCCVLAIDARRVVNATDNAADQTNTAPLSKQAAQASKPTAAPSQPAQSGRQPEFLRWEVLTHGGRKSAGLDALEWGIKAVALGAGEILLTSWDQDGTRAGFDLDLCRTFSEALPVPIIASGGAKDADSFIDVFKMGKADAALAATIFHDAIWSIGKIKEIVHQAGIQVRLC
jgi:cyclase